MIGRHAAMASRAGRLLVDTCEILSLVTTGTDAGGYPTTTWQAGDPIACRYVAQRSAERQPFTTQVATGQAAVYLPAGTAIAEQQRIRVTHRDGQEMSNPIQLAVDGLPDALPVYVDVPVRLVTEE